MKYVKYAVISLFCIAILGYVILWYYDKANTDYSVPVYKINDEMLEVSVDEENKTEALLKGVTVTDETDGDITNHVIVESVSKFIDKENHICKVTYAVEDSDHHVVKATRKVKLKDYVKPRFVLKKPLVFDAGSDEGPVDVIGAYDKYDGDISSKVKILTKVTSTNMAGGTVVNVQVSNSFGDTVKMKATVIFSQNNSLSPVFNFTKDIIYIKKGQKIKPKDYVKSVKDANGKAISISEVRISRASVKYNVPGCYFVEYKVEDSDNNEGTGYLSVMVEE